MNPETFKIELLTNLLTGSKLTFEHTYKRLKPVVRKELPQRIKILNVFANFSCFLSSKNVDSILKMVLPEGKVLTFKNNNNPKGLTNFDNIVKKLKNFIDKHSCYDFYVEIRHKDKKFVYNTEEEEEEDDYLSLDQRINQELPSKREEQETDKEHDSLKYPKVTKEQLDNELDEYISMRDEISEFEKL